MSSDKLLIGVDYGTDSVRTVLINASTGQELTSSVAYYPRWKKGLFCKADINQWRQHPLDYIESLTSAVQEMWKQVGPEQASKVVGIGVDTTGSTPVAVDRHGTPLALLDHFVDNPNAMFVLWRDHTSIKEAEEINELCRNWQVDYTKYEGGIYSSEWFWAKILHVLREDQDVYKAAYSWVEHCDWIPFLLTGGKNVHQMKRSRCAAGHKALWHSEFGGLPPNHFFVTLDPLLDGLRGRLFDETYTSDQAAGHLCHEWADKLGLHTDVIVAVGAFDAHMGAVGGEIQPYYLSKVMGTSTCDMLVAPASEVGDTVVRGICGQVDGSVIPGMLGLEAGQSAFGDVYAWFKELIAWPITNIIGVSKLLSEEHKSAIIEEALEKIIPELSSAAEAIDPAASSVIALDWLNGRRTPDANQNLKGVIAGLGLGSDAPKIFRALVEATCYGARTIVDRFQEEGIEIRGIIGLGGVAKKSPFVMQTMANVLNRPIKIAKSEQTCALGASMFAATAAGLYTNIDSAKNAMGSGFDHEYTPDPSLTELYDRLYKKYYALGRAVEKLEL
ncbi:MAG: ribulokinase [Saprospiraceae bacterium]|nr:ribulokinase [Saprospiraceae bacterium]